MHFYEIIYLETQKTCFLFCLVILGINSVDSFHNSQIFGTPFVRSTVLQLSNPSKCSNPGISKYLMRFCLKVFKFEIIRIYPGKRSQMFAYLMVMKFVRILVLYRGTTIFMSLSLSS